jgi:phenylacetic acid degradation operon negative regulatory protein
VAASLARRRERIGDLIGLARPLTARSVIASTLLGAREPTLPVAALITAAGVFGISSGATRTCLWRMVANGELTADDGTYSLAGRLVERRELIDDAARPAYVSADPWDGTWELAIVRSGARPAIERLELRRAATALHLAELREGVWTRPDNLAADRLTHARAVVIDQCVQFRGATTELSGEDVDAMFGVEAWDRTARRLADAIAVELDATGDGDEPGELLTFHFLLSIAVIRHLQLDPHLPDALVPQDWSADRLRDGYRALVQVLDRGLVTARTGGDQLPPVRSPR